MQGFPVLALQNLVVIDIGMPVSCARELEQPFNDHGCVHFQNPKQASELSCDALLLCRCNFLQSRATLIR